MTVLRPASMTPPRQRIGADGETWYANPLGYLQIIGFDMNLLGCFGDWWTGWSKARPPDTSGWDGWVTSRSFARGDPSAEAALSE